jgi:glycosyltransferase involved in cell wall biosynthesis
MTVVHQLVATFAPRDAVSNEVLEMAGVLDRHGVENTIHAERVVHELEGRAGLLGDLEVAPDDIVLLHYSIWSQAVERALTAPGKLVVRYHNVTPPEWFVGVNPAVAELCARGRAGLARIAPRCVLGIAASAYNRLDLAGAGFAATRVLPIVQPWRPVPRSVPDEPPVILYVGRLAPNKRVEELLRVFACYRRACELEARLVIVGTDSGFEPYGRAVRDLARALHLVPEFRSGISDAELEHLFSAASAFVTLSEHEGFCMPVIDAMRYRVPVLARPFAVLPETLGSGGLVAPTGDHAELAELLHVLVRDQAVRRALAEGAASQLQRLGLATVQDRFAAIVAEIAA